MFAYITALLRSITTRFGRSPGTSATPVNPPPTTNGFGQLQRVVHLHAFHEGDLVLSRCPFTPPLYWNGALQFQGGQMFKLKQLYTNSEWAWAVAHQSGGQPAPPGWVPLSFIIPKLPPWRLTLCKRFICGLSVIVVGVAVLLYASPKQEIPFDMAHSQDALYGRSPLGGATTTQHLITVSQDLRGQLLPILERLKSERDSRATSSHTAEVIDIFLQPVLHIEQLDEKLSREGMRLGSKIATMVGMLRQAHMESSDQLRIVYTKEKDSATATSAAKSVTAKFEQAVRHHLEQVAYSVREMRYICYALNDPIEQFFTMKDATIDAVELKLAEFSESVSQAHSPPLCLIPGFGTCRQTLQEKLDWYRDLDRLLSKVMDNDSQAIETASRLNHLCDEFDSGWAAQFTLWDVEMRSLEPLRNSEGLKGTQMFVDEMLDVAMKRRLLTVER